MPECNAVLLRRRRAIDALSLRVYLDGMNISMHSTHNQSWWRLF